MTFYDHIDDFSNSMKGASTKNGPAGLYLGTVERITGGVFISIPTISPGSTFGPCKTFGVYPVLGQTVLCGFLDGKFNEPIVIGRLAQSQVLKDVDTPVASTDGSNKLYVDNQIANLLSYVNAQLATKANI